MTLPAAVVVMAKGWPPSGGGIERYSQEIAEAYAAAGAQVHAVTPDPGVVTRPGAANVHTVGGRSQPHVAATMATLVGKQQLRRLARQPSWLPRHGFVHATTWRTGLVAVALGLHRQRPLIVTTHGREILGLGPVHRAARDAVLRRATVRLAVSPFTADLARVETGLSFTVALNGTSIPLLDAEQPDRRHTGQIRLLSVCRLEPRKNLAAVIDALERLSPRHDVTFTVVGDGPDRADLEARARRKGLAARVTFRGFVPDAKLWEEYRRADIFVHPQVALSDGVDVEGFGLTIADAMAVGLPVIVGEAGGPGTVIGNSGGGLVVEGHNIGQVTQALERLMTDIDLRVALGDKAAAFAANNLTWRSHVETVVDAIAALSPPTRERRP